MLFLGHNKDQGPTPRIGQLLVNRNMVVGSTKEVRDARLFVLNRWMWLASSPVDLNRIKGMGWASPVCVMCYPHMNES